MTRRVHEDFVVQAGDCQFVAAHEFIHALNSRAAESQRLLLLDGIYRLSQYPTMEREGRVPGTCELAIAGTPYIVAYQVRARSISILAVLHPSLAFEF